MGIHIPKMLKTTALRDTKSLREIYTSKLVIVVEDFEQIAQLNKYNYQPVAPKVIHHYHI